MFFLIIKIFFVNIKLTLNTYKVGTNVKFKNLIADK